MVSFLTAFLALTSLQLQVDVCLSSETGLIQLRRISEDPYDCSQSLLVFVCTTSGLGETRISLSNVDEEPLTFRHSKYGNGSTKVAAVESIYRDIISAINLTRSRDKDCFDPMNKNGMDFCYTTTVVVHLVDRTICNTINCYTIFNNGTRDISEQFGSATITTMPPPPANFRVMNQSAENVTFTWDPITNNCSNIHYHAMIVNCGSCPPNKSTTDNSITCKDLVPGQNCHISLQTVQQCGLSETVTLGVSIGGKFSTSAPVIQCAQVDVSVVVGVIITSTIFLLLIILPLLVLALVLNTRQSQMRQEQRNFKSISSCTNYPQQHYQDIELQQNATESVKRAGSASDSKPVTVIADERMRKHHDKDPELQIMEQSLKRAREESFIADKKKREAEENEKAAHKEAEQAHELAFALQLVKSDIEKVLNLQHDQNTEPHKVGKSWCRKRAHSTSDSLRMIKENVELNKKTLVKNCLERVCAVLENAIKWKNEAEQRHAKARDKKLKAENEAYTSNSKQKKIEREVQIYCNKGGKKETTV